jgi:hypothetical protein
LLNTDCSSWTDAFREGLAIECNIILSGGILSVCEECDTSDDILVVYPPTCSELVEGAALFRGRMTAQPKTLTATLCALKHWLQLGPSVAIATGISRVDQGCVMELSGECGIMLQNNVMLVAVVVSSIAGLLGMIILSIIAFFSLLWFKRYAKSHIVFPC